MEKSQSKNKLFGKIENDREIPENENDELRKIKLDDTASSSQQNNKDCSEDGIEDTISENISEERLSEEAVIENLFSDTLDIIRSKIDVEDKEIKEAYDEIIEKFKEFNFNKTDFNGSKNLIAYFFVYSAFNANLSRNRFIDSIQNCQQFQNCLENQDLKVISLGGGPGTDMIGFLSAFQDYLKQKEVEDQCSTIKRLNITVVDKWKRWASFNNVIEFLIREGDYGNVSTIYKSIDIYSSFMVIDLLKETQSTKFIWEIETADIVFLVRVLDTFNFKETKPKNFIRKYLSMMKSGALLLVIDSVIKYYNGSEATEIYTSNPGSYEVNINLEKIGIKESTKSSEPHVFILRKN